MAQLYDGTETIPYRVNAMIPKRLRSRELRMERVNPRGCKPNSGPLGLSGAGSELVLSRMPFRRGSHP